MDRFIQAEAVAPGLFHCLPMRLMDRYDRAAPVRSLPDDAAALSAADGLKDRPAMGRPDRFQRGDS